MLPCANRMQQCCSNKPAVQECMMAYKRVHAAMGGQDPSAPPASTGSKASTPERPLKVCSNRSTT